MASTSLTSRQRIALEPSLVTAFEPPTWSRGAWTSWAGAPGACAQVWIAMEFIAGRTLGEWARERQRGWREILGVLMDIARGVTAAHDAGLVHRDLKPGPGVEWTSSGYINIENIRANHIMPADTIAIETLLAPSNARIRVARRTTGQRLMPERE